jgi:hypothetical protein
MVSITSSNLTVNSAFDGNGNTSLLAPGNTLAVGQTGIVQVTVRALAGGKFGPYSNTATASGVSPGAVTVTDVSEQGTNPDPSNSGNPGAFSTPTVFDLPTSIAQVPTLGAAGLVLLAALLGLAAWRVLRRREARRAPKATGIS